MPRHPEDRQRHDGLVYYHREPGGMLSLPLDGQQASFRVRTAHSVAPVHRSRYGRISMHQPENPARRTLLGQAMAGSAALALGSLLGSAAGPTAAAAGAIPRKAFDGGSIDLLIVGGPVREGPLAAGAFYRPTLLEVDDPALDIVQKETFGPVLTLQVFGSEEEGVALANDSEYGLAAGVWTRDVARSFRVVRKIRAGTVWINDWATSSRKAATASPGSAA